MSKTNKQPNINAQCGNEEILAKLKKNNKTLEFILLSL